MEDAMDDEYDDVRSQSWIAFRALRRSSTRCARKYGGRQLPMMQQQLTRRIWNRSLTFQMLGLSFCLFIAGHVSEAVSSIRKHVDEEMYISPETPAVRVKERPYQHPNSVTETVASRVHDSQFDDRNYPKPPASAPLSQPGKISPIATEDTHTKVDHVVHIPEPPKAQRPPNTIDDMKSKFRLQHIHNDFLEWCVAAGIRTNLTIQFFDYQDFQQEHTRQKKLAEWSDDDDDNDNNNDADVAERMRADRSIVADPALQVRGLAATRDIQKGEVVISIPFSSMISVSTTIDADPILNKIMGPTVRSQNDWDDEFYELALLTVAILYHRKLKKASPLYHYISILETSPTDNIPYLWTKDRLKREAPQGVRRHASGLYKDIQEAHKTVLSILRRDYSTLFGSETYSLQNFMWAFALVNSRHWYLPIPDRNKKVIQPVVVVESEAPHEGLGDQQLPPASSPTDEWVSNRGHGDGEDTVPSLFEAHSFLAPVADLLNFGPPCTRGSYNSQTQAFELVATCAFLQGQEVTYWYSDDCDDIVIANYGFTHPMVPTCPTTEELRQEVDLWKRRSTTFEEALGNAHDDLEALERELKRVHDALELCNCDDTFDEGGGGSGHGGSNKSRKALETKHDHIRGSHSAPDYARHGIRRKAWDHRKSDIGL